MKMKTLVSWSSGKDSAWMLHGLDRSCGEYGEFHSFAYDGPMFGRPVAVSSGEVVDRDGFVFADVL
jgi:diphthamide synthase (EF-2-diphthine--ammonia ligase)